jgi:molybdopterin-guanine dinucleotide biosynthesis protein A
MSISVSGVSGAILAGGHSQRMGHDKATLLIDGELLLQRIARVMRSVVTNLAVIGPLERAVLTPDIPIIPDRWPDCGPLGGIATALHAPLSSKGVMVVGCDMPFLNPVLLHHLITLVPEADAVVVRLDGQIHPLHAVYQQQCLPILEAQLAVGDLRVHHFLTQIKVRYVETPELNQFDPTHLSTFNCNTPEEWQQALRLLAQMQTTHSKQFYT